jgi:hypothetical protein
VRAEGAGRRSRRARQDETGKSLGYGCGLKTKDQVAGRVLVGVGGQEATSSGHERDGGHTCAVVRGSNEPVQRGGGGAEWRGLALLLSSIEGSGINKEEIKILPRISVPGISMVSVCLSCSKVAAIAQICHRI